ncbi:cupin domain-containing protein [Candidatus Dojkabacteria bacterium]|uniref:Cupin domain-containing protein n=1 Tax=Candidatus Dojkabacteria bacterium TaxID=2099670 RepID=A0A955L1Q1_9BACT|nr:cupin domain-containing protein [Candidatus Dojkabacteria bacterium]
MNRSKVGYADNIENETLSNDYFRKVLYTGSNMQLVVMSLKPGEDIGMEVHEEHDQFFRIEEGVVTVYMDGEETELNADDVAIVPAGTEHNVTNTGNVPVKLYTIYAPPEHPDGKVDENKPE